MAIKSKPDREPGWYWIQIDRGWEPAEYYFYQGKRNIDNSFDYWSIMDEDERAVSGDDIKKINETRIKSPDES